MPAKFDVNRDIRKAATLPADVYHDPRWFDVQRERVFARTWQYVADRGRVRAPGHVLPFTLLDQCLDEPLLLSSGDDGQVRCMSNVCTHRGALVVEGEGHVRHLRCRYHGRRYALDGSFVSMPEFEGVEHFPTAADSLPQLALEEWGPLLFTALEPAMPFAEWIEPVRARTDWLPLDEFAAEPATTRDYYVAANWALYVDNYSEEFHIPYVHAGLSEQLDYASYRTETFRWGNLQLGVAKAGEPAFELPQGHPDHGQRIAAFYFWLFPNLMLNFYPWGLSANVVRPLGPARTRVSFLSYVWRPELRDTGVGAGLHRVEMEDEDVVVSVQSGVRSRLYDRGRYSPRREIGTHHFHRLLTSFMKAASAADIAAVD